MTITVEAELGDLAQAYSAALPQAVDVVGRRLLGAAWRERLGSARDLLAGRALRHYGFDRVELAQPVATHPAGLLDALGEEPGHHRTVVHGGRRHRPYRGGHLHVHRRLDVPARLDRERA